MSGLITAIVSLAQEIVKLKRDDKLMSHLENLRAIERKIMAEENKGYESDDALIENLYQEAKIESQAFQNQLALLVAAGSK